MSLMVALLAGVVAGIMTNKIVKVLLPRFPLRRANYRGILVPTGMGLGPILGLIAGATILSLGSAVSPGSFPSWIAPLAALAGFGLIGIFDDVVSTFEGGATKGFSGHFRELARGRLTSGGIKMIAGGAIAFAIAVPVTAGHGFLSALLATIVISLGANIWNCLDIRPGRSGKAFLCAAVPLAALSGTVREILLPAIGAIAAFLPFDLRERAMLGDAGANALGAFAGTCLVIGASRVTLLLLAGMFLLLQILAETITLSSAIAAIPFLRAADRWGRVSERTAGETTQPQALQ